MDGVTLYSYILSLQSHGQIVFSDREATETLGMGRGAFLDAAERLQQRKHLLRLRPGFYVIIPPSFRALGAPPPSFYIDDLMRHEGYPPYYVGLLKAAELHGATHQAIMQFQVITDKRLPEINAGRSTLSFLFRKDMQFLEPGITSMKTETDSMRVSSIELTILDLLRYSHASAGLSHVVTVLSDLGDRIDAPKLGVLSQFFERSVCQRLGYLLDDLGFTDRTEFLFKTLEEHYTSLRWIELDPGENSHPDFVVPPLERNSKWYVVVRKKPEIDE